MGYPVTGILGLDIKYTAGVISSESGFGDEASYMQVTVPLQPGNSGGPLINQQGEVVGVTTASARVESFFELSATIPQNINFAVKSNYVSTLVGQSNNNGPIDSREAAINRAKSAV